MPRVQLSRVTIKAFLAPQFHATVTCPEENAFGKWLSTTSGQWAGQWSGHRQGETIQGQTSGVGCQDPEFHDLPQA